MGGGTQLENDTNLYTTIELVNFTGNNNRKPKLYISDGYEIWDNETDAPVEPPSADDEITYSGLLYTWGWNTYGQVGLGHTSPVQLTPTKLSLTKWKSLAVLEECTSVISESGDMYSCGTNGDSQMGVGTAYVGPVILTKLNNTKWRRFYTGTGQSICAALTEDGRTFIWGNNVRGCLGIGSTQRQYTPILFNTTKWKQIDSFAYTTLAITENNELYGWGSNDDGQLGLGHTISQYTPIKLNDYKWKQVISAFHSSFAQTVEGEWYAWGNNYYGQLGCSFKSVSPQLVPIQIGHINNWKKIAAGINYTFMLDINNNLYGCGDNSDGVLGLGNTISRITPTLISATKWKQIYSNIYPVFAQAENGYWYSWGRNNYGELGLGHSSYGQYTPCKISDTKWQYIGTMSHTAAIL